MIDLVIDFYERSDVMAKRIIFGIAIAIWLVVIFNFSAMDSKESTVESKTFTTNVVTVTSSFADKVGIIEEMPSEREIAKIVTDINPIVRKCAHATVYLVLGLLILLAMDTKTETFWRNSTIAVIACLLYAITDELHQTFVPGRAGELRDCLIDASGAIVACCLYKLGMKLFDRRVY